LSHRRLRTTILMIMLLSFSTMPTPKAAVEHLKSRLLRNPVTPDGEVTNDAEWSDTEKKEILLGLNCGKSPPYLRAWVWAKNDNHSLYMLLKIEHFKSLQYDLEDQAFIYYLWSEATTIWDRSDAAWAYQLSSPSDLCGLTGSTWTHDTVAGGSNDAQGSGYYDTLFYWFEIVKALDTGDGCDWALELGDTIGAGNPTQTTDLLYVGILDDSSGNRIENGITLTLSPPQRTLTPVGGILEPNTPNLQGLALMAIITALVSFIALKQLRR